MKKSLRKLRALISRTFVTDCPVCHKHFYGFHAYATDVKIKNIHYRIICHKCSQEHKELKK